MSGNIAWGEKMTVLFVVCVLMCELFSSQPPIPTLTLITTTSDLDLHHIGGVAVDLVPAGGQGRHQGGTDQGRVLTEEGRSEDAEGRGQTRIEMEGKIVQDQGTDLGQVDLGRMEDQRASQRHDLSQASETSQNLARGHGHRLGNLVQLKDLGRDLRKR